MLLIENHFLNSTKILNHCIQLEASRTWDYTTVTMSHSASHSCPEAEFCFAWYKSQQYLECEDTVRTSSRFKPRPKGRDGLPTTVIPETSDSPASCRFLDIHVEAGEHSF